MWREVSAEKENDVASIACSFLAFLALRFGIVHNLPTIADNIVVNQAGAATEVWCALRTVARAKTGLPRWAAHLLRRPAASARTDEAARTHQRCAAPATRRMLDGCGVIHAAHHARPVCGAPGVARPGARWAGAASAHKHM